MEQYKQLVKNVLENGTEREDRTGVGTLSVFGTQNRYDLRDGFPLVTLKKTYFSSVVKELLWFLRGETNIKTLGCGIWDQWATTAGELGPVYGQQWRAWSAFMEGDPEGNSGYGCGCETFYIDQIKYLIDNLKSDPLSRRHIVSAWNVGDLSEMMLQPCHVMFQCYASEISFETRYQAFRSATGIKVWRDEDLDQLGVPKYYLDLQLYQRSADLMLGVPFNIASYSLLLILLAREVNMIPRFFIHTIGDAHIYKNHIDGAKEMLTREPLLLPSITIVNRPLPYPGCPRDGAVLEPHDFILENYQSHPFIKLEVAV